MMLNFAHFDVEKHGSGAVNVDRTIAWPTLICISVD